MRRREERLKYWLERGSQSQQPGFSSGLIRTLALKLRLGQSAGDVREESLALYTGAICLDDELAATASVTDGLNALGEWTDPTLESFSGFIERNNRVRYVELFRGAKAVNVRLPDHRMARIQQECVSINPICRPFQVSMKAIEVHELNHPHNQPPALKDGSRFLITNPPVQLLTSLMSDLPHARASIRIEALDDSERNGFLREAEVLKGIRPDRAELLAVFRHVPIEVISRLRYLEEKKAILYSIPRDVRPTCTRVHDMAAVLDIGSKEIHLVPHRTRFESVSLN